MRSNLALCLLGLLGACASTGSRIIVPGSDQPAAVDAVAAAVVDADLVALGELHHTPGVHRTHHALLRAMHQRRPNLVIAMEMFERDVQPVLQQYLDGEIDEAAFRAGARPWPHYERDYRPVIEFAKRHGLPVLAANAPRPLATKAAKEGLDAVMGSEHLARATTAPQDGYWESFQEMMAGHGGMLGEDGMARFYAAQCLKDDTMAESIVDYLAGVEADRRPLAVLICGRAHSDHGWGTVQRVVERMPGIEVRVLSAETVDDAGGEVTIADGEVADFVVVAPAPQRDPMPAMPASKPSSTATAGGDGGPTENPEGLRPAFGFMPDYAGEDEGVLVGEVFEGRPAFEAGIEPGDRILAINGQPTLDLEEYTEVLDTLIIGRTVTVRVRREGAEVDLEVKVGSRAAR
ncbi:MAG: ChaN family lipoprotein [Planctomycetota bacterium]